MAVLGDAFPEGFKDEYADGNIKPGIVLKLHIPEFNIGHPKRFAIVGVHKKESVLVVVFNSENNAPHRIKDLSLKVKCDGKDYLDKDCYANCAVPREFTFSWLLKSVKDNPGCVLGVMDGKDLGLLQMTLSKARTVNNKIKSKYKIV